MAKIRVEFERVDLPNSPWKEKAWRCKLCGCYFVSRRDCEAHAEYHRREHVRQIRMREKRGLGLSLHE